MLVSRAGVDSLLLLLLLLLFVGIFCLLFLICRPNFAVVIGFERLKGLAISPMGVGWISVIVVALGLFEWALSISFAIVEDRQQLSQRSSGTNCVGFYV